MKINKNMFVAIAIAVLSFGIFAQDIHTNIRQSLALRDYKAAITELQNLRQSDRKVFQANNYDYLLARIAEKSGNISLATASYQSAIKRNSVLKEYSLWHLSQIMRSSGNLMLEKVYLQQLRSLFPNSLLLESANKRLALSNFESGNFETAISLLSALGPKPQTPIVSPTTTPTPKPGNDAKTRENLVYIGQSQMKLGKTSEARVTFAKLIDELPNPSQPDDFALLAVKGLDEIDGGKESIGKVAPKLAENEHQKRAEIYQFNRDFADARLHYSAIIQNYSSSEFVPDALYQIGRGFVQENRFNESIQYFERVQTEFPTDPIAKDALSQSASAFSKVNKNREAVSRYKSVIDRFPNSTNIERAYLNIVDIYRDMGEENDALTWTTKTQEIFRGKLPEAIALFSQLRSRITQGDWNNALADADKLLQMPDLGGTKVASGTNKNEVTFLRGLILEEMTKIPEAIDVFLSISDGRGEYYGWRATEKLRKFATDEVTKPFVTNKLAALTANLNSTDHDANRKNAQAVLRLNDNAEMRAKMLDIVKKSYSLLPSYQKIPTLKLLEFGRKEILKSQPKAVSLSHQTLADELLFLGLFDEATPELETTLREKLPKNTGSMSDFSSDAAFTLATFYNRGDMANRAVGFIEPLWRNVPNDYLIELMPKDQATLLYPVPYADSLLKYAPARNVDPRYALSIMRQESRYRADVKSVAAARGLMQFISTTSNTLAVELGKPNFKQDELYNPPTAILFGSQYLGNLYKLFPNQSEAVAASYNGGETNMSRWLARSKSDLPNRYVSEIVFSQSKDYVYKVMANFRVYQVLYDENLHLR
jgi:soluble lytic murein transglycosylase